MCRILQDICRIQWDTVWNNEMLKKIKNESKFKTNKKKTHFARWIVSHRYSSENSQNFKVQISLLRHWNFPKKYVQNPVNDTSTSYGMNLQNRETADTLQDIYCRILVWFCGWNLQTHCGILQDEPADIYPVRYRVFYNADALQDTVETVGWTRRYCGCGILQDDLAALRASTSLVWLLVNGVDSANDAGKKWNLWVFFFKFLWNILQICKACMCSIVCMLARSTFLWNRKSTTSR